MTLRNVDRWSSNRYFRSAWGRCTDVAFRKSDCKSGDIVSSAGAVVAARSARHGPRAEVTVNGASVALADRPPRAEGESLDLTARNYWTSTRHPPIFGLRQTVRRAVTVAHVFWSTPGFRIPEQSRRKLVHLGNLFVRADSANANKSSLQRLMIAI